MKKFFLFYLCLLSMMLGARDQSWQRAITTLPERSDGVFLRLYPDNVFRLFGVGSAAFEKDADNDDKLRVEKMALLKARTELIKFFQQTLESETSLRSFFKKAEKEVKENHNKQNQSQTISEEDFLSQMKGSSSGMIRGIVVLKVITIPDDNGGGVVKALVGVSSLTTKISDAILTSPELSSSPVTVSGTTVRPVKKKIEYIDCVGRGKNREEAVKAALLEGIRQIYGVYLENDETLKERFRKVKNQRFSSEKEGNQRIFSQSRGFIQDYRILSITPVDSLLEARIKARIINPRSDGMRTIICYPMSISLSKGSNMYDAGPDLQMSGAEIASLCSQKFEKAFLRADKFIVLNQSDVRKVLKEQDKSSKLILAGKALPLEMAAFGQILCADYIFIPEFKDFSYSRKIGFDVKTKKISPKVSMRLFFDFRLIEVRTGSQIKNETLSIVINDQDLSQLPQKENLKSDMLELLISKAVKVLSQKVNF